MQTLKATINELHKRPVTRGSIQPRRSGGRAGGRVGDTRKVVLGKNRAWDVKDKFLTEGARVAFQLNSFFLCVPLSLSLQECARVCVCVCVRERERESWQ